LKERRKKKLIFVLGCARTPWGKEIELKGRGKGK